MSGLNAFVAQAAESDEYDYDDADTAQAYAEAVQYSELAYLSLNRFKGKRKGKGKAKGPFKGSKGKFNGPSKGSSKGPFKGSKSKGK